MSNDRIEGWKCIADALGVASSTARLWADRSDDPLPVQRHRVSGRVAIERRRLDEWAARQWATGSRERSSA